MLWSVIRLIFKTSSVTPDFFYVFNLILSFSTCSQSLKKSVRGNFWARTSLSACAAFFFFFLLLLNLRLLHAYERSFPSLGYLWSDKQRLRVSSCCVQLQIWRQGVCQLKRLCQCEPGVCGNPVLIIKSGNKTEGRLAKTL